MINVGPSYKYTFDVDNSNVSSSGYNVYYISDYNDMEYDIRYTFTQGKTTEEKDSRKETRRKEG
tara:strand:+ start:256 stop:447 length:192 start_codon:yes stop_codon:yes gene_type:complete